jgi:ParB-like chromosome segregation protein Spo0J
MSGTITIDTVELVHLDLVYAHTRIRRPRQIAHLADSLIRHGQLLPIVVVAGEHPRWVLIDGYLRVEAARCAGIDTLAAHIWPGRPRDAVCQLLSRDGARQFDVFEQAALLRELKIAHGLSQNQIAVSMGRHPSWVTRRLALIEQLPAPAIEAVRTGRLSTWSASRVLVPLARANTHHARTLVDAINNNPLTSRQLLYFWQHYQQANRAVREKMVAEPILFFKSSAARKADEQARRVHDGPEGRWRRDMRTVKHILQRLEHTARQVFYPEQTALVRRTLLTAFSDAHSVFDLLNHTIERLSHEKPSRQTSRHRHEPGRSGHPPDQPHPENVPQDHPADPGRQRADTRCQAQSV